MNAIVAYNERDLADIHTLLGADDAEKLKLKALAVAHFMRAKDRRAAAKEIAATFGAKLTGISFQSLYRLAERFAASGGSLRSLMDGRQLRKMNAGGLADNAEFKAFWWQLCLDNKRATAPAYRELFRRLAAGETIPGFGDWREIFASEHGGLYPAPERACPYAAGAVVPKGWSARNLAKLKPDEFALVAARKGTMAATMAHLPDIHRTRVGLKCCQVVQIDDMWYEHKVAFGANRHAQRVVEFSMIDVATGKFFAWLTKPVLEKEDGKKETLKSRWTRYLVAHLLGTVGVPDEGVLIMGEHGTASADGSLEESLARISGGRVRFGAGGLLSTPLGKGLYQGTPKGNPRYKGLLEGQHSLIKNELAAVRGHMGGGRDAQCEFVYGMERQDEQLRAIARALRNVRPGIETRMDFPFMDFLDFKAIVDAMYDHVNGRRTHSLEGWDEMGFMSAEYFDASAAAWVPVENIRRETSPIVAKALLDAIHAGHVKVRRARLSPAEAWNLRAGDRTWRLPPGVIATEVLGPQLAMTAVCSEKLELKCKDDSTLAEYVIPAIVDGGVALTRGAGYLVWVNPLDPFTAYVADAQGKFVGVARVSPKVCYGDQEEIERQLGVRQAALAAERKRLQPAITRMQMREAARAAKNAEAVFGEDPAMREAVADAAGRELVRVKAADLDLAGPGGTDDAEPVADLGFGGEGAADDAPVADMDFSQF